jgi:hypothetical protein
LTGTKTVELLLRVLVDCCEVSNSGIVDQNVQASEGIHGLLDGRGSHEVAESGRGAVALRAMVGGSVRAIRSGTPRRWFGTFARNWRHR